MPFDEAHHDHGGGGGDGEPDPHDFDRMVAFVHELMHIGAEMGAAQNLCPICSAGLLMQALARSLAQQSAEYKTHILNLVTEEMENKNVH